MIFIIHKRHIPTHVKTDTFNFDAMAAAISTSQGAHISGESRVEYIFCGVLNARGDVLE